MAKKVVGYIKLQVKAGQANPSPPVGPALGQRGLNIMEFCKAFNAATQKMEPGIPIPVIITAYSDRSFTFITKTPPATILLKKAVGIQSGSKRPNPQKVRNVTPAQREPQPTQQNPSHTYATAGNYTICLISTNPCGSDTSCQSLVVCNVPVANFNFTTNGLSATFNNVSTNGTTYFWNFGDGVNSAQQNPTHA